MPDELHHILQNLPAEFGAKLSTVIRQRPMATPSFMSSTAGLRGCGVYGQQIRRYALLVFGQRSGSPPPRLDPASELGKLWAHPDAPDYAQFVEPAATYFKQYLEALAAWKGVRRGDRKASRDVWTRQVIASWGLLARGRESLPLALKLIHSDDPDAREQGARLLGDLGKDPSVTDELIKMLQSETDDVARDSAIIALGQMKSKRALPTLERILRDATADSDTRWTAGESVGRIVGRRFGKSDGSVIDEAIAWLDAHPRRHL